MQQIQQAVDLQDRQIRHPALEESRIGILQHPQETHQKCPAALSRQRAGLAPRLVKTNTPTQRQSQSASAENGCLQRVLKGRAREPPAGGGQQLRSGTQEQHGKNANAF